MARKHTGIEGRIRLRELEERENQAEKLRELEKKSPFRDFAQVNRTLIPHIIKGCEECPVP